MFSTTRDKDRTGAWPARDSSQKVWNGLRKWVLEGFGGGWLDRANLPDLDGGGVEVFPMGWGAGEAAKHCQLTSVRECVGYRALKEAINGSIERRGRG